MPRAGTAAYLREHDMDRVAVVEADLVGRLVGPDGAADRVQEQDGLGVERVLAAVHVHEPPQLQVALDAEEDVVRGLTLHLDVDEGITTTVLARLGLHRLRGLTPLLLSLSPLTPLLLLLLLSPVP